VLYIQTNDMKTKANERNTNIIMIILNIILKSIRKIGSMLSDYKELFDGPNNQENRGPRNKK
jgi:hypothetical protein